MDFEIRRKSGKSLNDMSMSNAQEVFFNFPNASPNAHSRFPLGCYTELHSLELGKSGETSKRTKSGNQYIFYPSCNGYRVYVLVFVHETLETRTKISFSSTLLFLAQTIPFDSCGVVPRCTYIRYVECVSIKLIIYAFELILS